MITKDMSRPRPHSRSRTAILMAGLLAFVVGSNNCLLAAWSGDVTMPCLAPGIEAASDATSCCGHAAAEPVTKAKQKSCCIGLAPIATPPTVGDARDAGPLVAVAASSPEMSETLAIDTAERPPPEHCPAQTPHTAPLSSRAPPLLAA
jgi:hypothetical protein